MLNEQEKGLQNVQDNNSEAAHNNADEAEKEFTNKGSINCYYCGVWS